VWSKVIGWEKKRNRGGTNHVALRKPVNEFMCDYCMRMKQSGASPDQSELW
jgi:hypothetical protein